MSWDDDDDDDGIFDTSKIPFDPGIHVMKAEDGLRIMPDNSVDFIMLDGPYFISGEDRPADFGEWDESGDPSGQMAECMSECYRCLAPTGSIIVWSGFEAVGELARLAKEIGFGFKRQILWTKPSASPLMADRGWLMCVENGFWATKSKGWDHHTFRRMGRSKNWYESPPVRGEDRFHRCQKPVDLYFYFMKELVLPGDVVVEPYCGSAPAAEACKRIGATYYGFEKDETIAVQSRRLRGV